MCRLLPVLAALSLVLLGAVATRAEGGRSTWLDAVRSESWSDADALAAGQPDPLARKLVLYYRLLAPGAARAAELAAFISDNPDWPGQTQLVRRLSDAMDQNGRSVLDVCQARVTQTTLPRCPAAVLDAARLGSAVERARVAWVRGVEPAAEPAFLRQWSQVLTADDHWRRFDRLAAADTGAPNSPAARQAARLDAMRPVAEARLALRRDDAAAAVKLIGKAEPSLVFELARWHRRAGRDAEAAEIWLAQGRAAEAAAPPDRRGPFWDERNLLTRRLLRSGQAATAYALVSSHSQVGEAALDAEFLAGWIALRRLDSAETAARHFQVLAGQSKAAITQGRAHYWIGRAATAQGNTIAADAYATAAAWPTTYYGQLAARALGDDNTVLAARIAALQDPAFTMEQGQAVLARELARAAVLLVAWGEPRRAKAFLQRLDDTAGDTAERSAIARLTGALGLPDHAVALARRAGRDGVVLVNSGWPRPVSPPGTVERAVALALIRQESSFDAQAASPAGARGLMQLMPATAAAVARRLNEPADLSALTRDPDYNMRLGTAYLSGLLEQFGGALPLALAGYNAGPSRVNEWIAANGDPRSGTVDMTDWIELIPFSETRNYVQRVLENVEIYRARQDTALQIASGGE